MSAALLFIYGSLQAGAPGLRAAQLLQGAWPHARGRVRGRLLDLGAYPGLLLRPAQARVFGQVVRLRRPRRDLWRLDRYEECVPGQARPWEYRRQRVTVHACSGVPVRCWAYVYARRRGRAPWVRGGDWLALRPRPRL